MDNVTTAMMAEYASGKTIREIATSYGCSTGKVYKLLRESGCAFRRRGNPKGWQPSPDRNDKISKALRGRKMSTESRHRLSEAKKCNYNGLNGYGHTKPHGRGYVLAYAPLHPHAHKDGYIMLHTVVMERSIGRYLAPDETVHHKNHIRNDNRIENLELMKKHDHFSMHMKERHRKGVLPSIS